MDSSEPIRDNVKKALQEQMTLRMAENTGPKFTDEQILQFAQDTEYELHELFKDVGMKYKAKYRSLMFNIKDRKNLSLWHKICDGTITPKQLVSCSFFVICHLFPNVLLQNFYMIIGATLTRRVS